MLAGDGGNIAKEGSALSAQPSVGDIVVKVKGPGGTHLGWQLLGTMAPPWCEKIGCSEKTEFACVKAVVRYPRLV